MNIINFHLKLFYVGNENEESLHYADLIRLLYDYHYFDAEIIKTILLHIIFLHFNSSCYIFLVSFCFIFSSHYKIKKATMA